MNLSALPELLLAWVKAQGATLLQGNKAEQAAAFKVGAEYEGKVLDQLPSGRHLVQVAGQKLDMGLPNNPRTGDTVRLTFLASGARPTFLMSGQPQATTAQPVQISNTAQQVNALMRIAQPPGQAAAAGAGVRPGGGPVTGQPVATPTPGGEGAAARNAPDPAGGRITGRGGLIPAGITASGASNLSAGAPATAAAQRPASEATAAPDLQRLGRTSQGAQVPAGPPTSAPVSGTPRPIVANVVMLQGYAATAASAATGSPTAVASANTALHGQAVDQLRAALASSTSLRPTVLADPAAPGANLLPARLAQTVRESGLFYEAHLARWTKGAYPFDAILNEPQARLGRTAMPMPAMVELAGMPEEAARMAGRQLHMLDGNPFLWQGFAWPGQWMEWLVEERQDGQSQGQGGEEPNPWATELHLTLPRMGAIQARLSVRGSDVTLRLQVEEAATAQAMTNALPVLQRGLESAGLRPTSLAVVGAEA